LDIQSNRIEDEAILDVVAAIPDLRVLYLMGNPVVNKIRHYRKVSSR
jgi:dynein assembly factor 1, axonemal